MVEELRGVGQAVDWARTHAVVVAMCTVFACLRLVSALSGDVWTDPDSISYFDFDVWRPLRLWTVPLVYSIGLSDHSLVVLQTVVGVTAWVSGAVLISRIFARRAAEIAAVAGVLVVGLTRQVTNFDTALLSESITLSLTVVLVALGLNVICRPSTRLVYATAAVAFLWAFSRQSNVYLLGVAAVIGTFVALRRPRRRQLAVLGCVLGVVTVVGIVVSSSNTSVQHWNVAEIIVRRVEPDHALLSWWRHEGMPKPPTTPSPLAPNTNPPDAVIFAGLHRLLEDRRFDSWLEDSGTSTYLHFLTTHPHYVAATPFTDRAVLDGFLRGVVYARVTQVVPTVVEDVVWPPSRKDALLVVATAGILLLVMLAWSSRRTRRAHLSGTPRRALRYAVVVLAMSGVATILSAHVAGAEFGRILLVPGVAARLAIVIAAAALIESWSERFTHYACSGAEVDRADRAHATGVEVVDRREDLVTGVHDEGAVVRDRLADGESTEQ